MPLAGSRSETRLSDARAGTPPFHTKAWLVWLLSSIVVVNTIENPFIVPLVFGSLTAVAGSFARPGPEARSFATLVKIGLAFTVFRVVLFAATGHTGATPLLTTPEIRLPRWLGDVRLGGRVTAEVTLQSALEGLRLAAFLGCLGAFLCVTDMYRVLRLLPRFLAEASLVVTIALAFVPTMFRMATEIRDAQRLRGHRARGLRSIVPLALPVLASGLERSVTLAESMEVRGYGRRLEGSARVEAWARALALAATISIAAGGSLVVFGRGPAGVGVGIFALGVVALAVALAALSRVIPRTRMRAERWSVWDWALAGCVAASAVGALAIRAFAGAVATYYPYPKVFWPRLQPAVFVLGAAIAAPALLGAVRKAVLVRAEARHAPVGTAGQRESVAASR
jgi:energy-coupling factor transport system permease protein